MTYVTTVVNYFSCLAEAERRACAKMAGSGVPPLPVVFAFEIDLIFTLYSGFDAETRRKAWEANFVVSRETIEIDGTEVEIYLSLQPWVLEVALALLNGDISVSMPLCAAAAFSITEP